VEVEERMLLLLTRGEVKDCTPAAAKRREAHAIFMVVYINMLCGWCLRVLWTNEVRYCIDFD